MKITTNPAAMLCRKTRTIAGCLMVAVAAVGVSASAIAQTSGSRPALQAVMHDCKADRERLCSGVSPGGGRIAGCLLKNPEALTPACRNALGDALEARDTRAGSVPR